MAGAERVPRGGEHMPCSLRGVGAEGGVWRKVERSGPFWAVPG